jgi:hypothetical protein
MAEETGSGVSGFLAAILLVAIIVVSGILLYGSGGVRDAETAQIDAQAPNSMSAPNLPARSNSLNSRG